MKLGYGLVGVGFLFYSLNMSYAQVLKLPPEVKFSGGDGSSIEQAIMVEGAQNEMVGVSSERQWLRTHFANMNLGTQSLLRKNGRAYDRFDLSSASGEKKTIFFDITGYFGKY